MSGPALGDDAAAPSSCRISGLVPPPLLLLPTPEDRAVPGVIIILVESLLGAGEAAREDGLDFWICWTLWDELRSDVSERRRAKFWSREKVGEEEEEEEEEKSDLVGEGAVVKVRGRDGEYVTGEWTRSV